MTEKANNIRVTKNAEDVFTALRIFFELINMAVPKVDNQLTDAEIQLLCLFMSLPQDKFRHQRFGKLAKKKSCILADLLEIHTISPTLKLAEFAPTPTFITTPLSWKG